MIRFVISPLQVYNSIMKCISCNSFPELYQRWCLVSIQNTFLTLPFKTFMISNLFFFKETVPGMIFSWHPWIKLFIRKAFKWWSTDLTLVVARQREQFTFLTVVTLPNINKKLARARLIWQQNHCLRYAFDWLLILHWADLFSRFNAYDKLN